MHLILFAIAWFLVIYLVNSLFARKFIRIEWPLALLYISSTAMLGMIGEILVDSVYLAITGNLFWVYHVLPIHEGYTSQYSLFLWGLGGFNFYLLHNLLKSYSIHKLAIIFCVESLIIDGLVNLSFWLIFGGYIYYYLPGDLYHFTSLQALPFYLLAGYVTFAIYSIFMRRRILFTVASSLTVLLIGFILPNIK